MMKNGKVMIDDQDLSVEIGEAKRLGSQYAESDHDLALVGGPVRDLMLGSHPKDFDMTTDARPDVSERILKAWGSSFWNVGKKYGTIGAGRDVSNGVHMDVEVTTYRSDSYDGRSRKPAVKWGSSLEGDLHRRDFTMNAMAITLPGMKLVDPFHGAEAIKNKIIMTPGSPYDSFNDDPLRMLRAVRFAGKLGFHLDGRVLDAIREMAPRLDEISRERVSDELSKIMLSAHPVDALKLMMDSGLMDHVLPEFSELKRSDATSRGMHKLNYEHSLTVLENAISMEDRLGNGPDLILRLSALLHDVGKARTRRFNGRRKVTFDQHEFVGADMIRKRLRALKYPNDVVKTVSDLIGLHMRAHGYESNGWTDSAVRRFVHEVGPLYDRLMILTRADVTTSHASKKVRVMKSIDSLEAHVDKLWKMDDLNAVRPEIDGNEIMKILQIRPGKIVGQCYRHMLEYRIVNGAVGHAAAVQELKRFYAEIAG
jgi:poly(A) polymerase